MDYGLWTRLHRGLHWTLDYTSPWTGLDYGHWTRPDTGLD